MELIADGLLIATALTAALYCLVLSRRLSRLTDAEAGIGAQIQSLSRALEETRTGLAETRRGVAEARGSARNATEALGREVERARLTLGELGRAHSLALDMLGRFDGARRRTGTAPGDSAVRSGAAVFAERTAPRVGDSTAQGAAPMDPSDRSGAPSRAAPLATPDADRDDDIPDWPDGVIEIPGDAGSTITDGPNSHYAPDEDQRDSPPAIASAAAQTGRRDSAANGGAPLRVERMAL